MVREDVPTVPLDGKQQTRMRNFYPPLILLESIHGACTKRAVPKAAESPPNPSEPTAGRFETFVNKLAHICDYRPRGETVTALAVLVEENGRVLYLFASNRRARTNLNKTRQDLIETLNILRDNLNPDTRVPDNVLNERLLRQVLAVNTVRIQGYLSALSKELKACIKACERNSAIPGSEPAAQKLKRLLNMIPDTKQAGQKSDEFVTSTIQCIQEIQEYRQLPIQHFIEKQAYRTSEQLSSGQTWSNLQHVTGRLLSYQYDVETLISAHHIWGDTELFGDYDVDFLPSSDPYPASVTRFTPETAEAIINRHPQASHRAVLKQHAADLQPFNLDGMLEDQWKRKIEPIVHAEVLLHDWLSRTPGGVRESRFFGNWRYIGTSKPICRLCKYYFDIIATPVRFRKGHPNTYLNWRPPDVRLQEGNQDVEQEKIIWLHVIDQMKARVYADMRRLLVEKATDKKHNDSNTNTDRITLDGLQLLANLTI